MPDPRQKDLWFVDNVYKYRSELRAWLVARFSLKDDADDIVQEAFVRILKAHSEGTIINPRAFLYVTARNLVHSRFRHQLVERPPSVKELSAAEIANESDNPLEELTKSEDIQILIRSIRTLPKRCRQVMTLRKIYGYSLKEVAKILGISVSAVDTQCAIGLKKCAAYFAQENLGKNQQ